ncbi:hypothetical protein BH18THE2_BH18THE2_21030 [soil metagenome]
MTSYDDLLKEARTRVADFQKLTSREFIPRMYTELCNENSGITPEDARDRIEKDCVGIWSKRTILDVLPEETKDPKKQKAGRLRQKKSNSAALTAAPEAREILVDMQGRTICNMPPGATTSGSPSEEGSRDHDTNTVAVVEPLDLRKGNKTTTHNRRKCTICQEQIQNNEPIGVVNNATQLTETSTILSPSFRQGTNESEENKIVLFEFSLGLQDLRNFVHTNYKITTSEGKVWFHGSLDIRTGEVIDPHIRKSPKDYVVVEEIVED